MKDQGWLTVFVWICGYGFGVMQTGFALLGKPPEYAGWAIAIGAFIGISGWFWHFMQKPNGGIDKITERVLKNKFEQEQQEDSQ